MRTFTLAEAARLLRTSRSVLYRKIDEGVLTYTSGGGPGKTSTVTEEALRLAGFDVPPEVETSRTSPRCPEDVLRIVPRNVPRCPPTPALPQKSKLSLTLLS